MPEGKLYKHIKNNISEKDTRAFIHSFNFNVKNISVKYIHLKVKNIGVCPGWHKGAGEKARLFCDEISIE